MSGAFLFLLPFGKINKLPLIVKFPIPIPKLYQGSAAL